MQNFFYKLRCAMARFMYGRNGADALCWALLIGELALSLLAGLIGNAIFATVVHYASPAMSIYLIFRLFSRDLTKRRAENAAFLRWWSPKKRAAAAARARRADREHKYVKCSCGTWCRVPRGVGKIELRCPKCGATRFVKT